MTWRNIWCYRHAHKGTVMNLKWNQNGNWLLTASRDHLMKLFDIRNMKEEFQTFKGHKKEATAVAWHPIHEGLFVSGGSDGAVMFWMVGTDREVGGMEEAHEGMVWSLAWHPLGHILVSGSNDHTTKFWTRNRPGDRMRDKYNLNTLPGGSEHEMPEFEPDNTGQSNIPGMGITPADKMMNEQINKNQETEGEDLPSIPGLDWSADEQFFREQQLLREIPKKKIPYARPIPWEFEQAWMVKHTGLLVPDGEGEEGAGGGGSREKRRERRRKQQMERGADNQQGSGDSQPNNNPPSLMQQGAPPNQMMGPGNQNNNPNMVPPGQGNMPGRGLLGNQPAGWGQQQGGGSQGMRQQGPGQQQNQGLPHGGGRSQGLLSNPMMQNQNQGGQGFQQNDHDFRGGQWNQGQGGNQGNFGNNDMLNDNQFQGDQDFRSDQDFRGDQDFRNQQRQRNDNHNQNFNDGGQGFNRRGNNMQRDDNQRGFRGNQWEQQQRGGNDRNSNFGGDHGNSNFNNHGNDNFMDQDERFDGRGRGGGMNPSRGRGRGQDERRRGRRNEGGHNFGGSQENYSNKRHWEEGPGDYRQQQGNQGPSDMDTDQSGGWGQNNQRGGRNFSSPGRGGH
ncbi:pre-mRNA 3' end processing protein WDR33-like [Argopecten irradians]|uniref:pre-mRNA 3' end processing protein WDR33-like n=1 Tax=Argopecten irradians TaxID=31199 RepID=UPI00371B0D11